MTCPHGIDPRSDQGCQGCDEDQAREEQLPEPPVYWLAEDEAYWDEFNKARDGGVQR